jgi:beta-lactamase regulating signal transducer with metallopeptidase domain
VGIPAANAAISEHFPDFSGAPGVNPIEAWITAGMVVWLAGLAALLGYSLLSYMRLRKRVATAVKLTDGVFEADGIRSPFVLGFLHPKIYIPFGLTEREKSYILRHEACHIERKDPIVKLAAFLILSLHWFNPLVWLAFALMTKDMEMSCDERVLSASGDAIKSDYSASLLSLAVGRRFRTRALAFGESVVKGRIQNILRFKSRACGSQSCGRAVRGCHRVVRGQPEGSGRGGDRPDRRWRPQ